MSEMRKFHNFIKKIYIDKSSEPGTRLLDLGCGKGGDIYKWISNKNIVSVKGFDINADSIAEAKRRLKGYSNFKKKSITFKVLDLSENVLKCPKKFDLITSFFAFHYFFKNKKSIETILKSIDNCSKAGTTLILTLFDGNLINFLPDTYKADNWEIKKLSNSSKGKVLGRKIEVFLGDSVLDVPEIEYIVEPDLLVNYLKTINFDLVDSKPFYEIKNKKFHLSVSEKLFSDLNMVFVFKKM